MKKPPIKRLSPRGFERELAALKRLLAHGQVKPDEFNALYEDLLERLKG